MKVFKEFLQFFEYIVSDDDRYRIKLIFNVFCCCCCLLKKNKQLSLEITK